MKEDREKVALKLAEKNGAKWEGLTEIMRNAYLHNADEDIKTRATAPVIVDGKEVKVACKVCKDKAFIDDGQPCPECNPVGLPAGEVHPGAAKAEVKEEAKKLTVGIGNIDLCTSCKLDYPGCDSPNVEYGTDPERADKVVKCEIYSPTKPTHLIVKPGQEEEARELIRATRVLKPSEYRCRKCSKPGKTVIHMVKKNGKGIGTKHAEFKV